MPSGYGDFLIDYLLDWCGLLVRWLHVVAGIAWIGSSFYFVWLDNHLEPQGASEPIDPNVAGELWAVHGGGFYRSRKYRVAPPVLLRRARVLLTSATCAHSPIPRGDRLPTTNATSSTGPDSGIGM